MRPQAPDITPDLLARFYCVRCKNLECDRSGWRSDPLSERVRTQAERLLNPRQADPKSSRYAPIVQHDFVDKREEAEAWSRSRPSPPNFLEASETPAGVPLATPARRPVLRAVPMQSVWEVGSPTPTSAGPVRDPWDPRSGRTVAPRATLKFREDGTIDLGTGGDKGGETP